MKRKNPFVECSVSLYSEQPVVRIHKVSCIPSSRNFCFFFAFLVFLLIVCCFTQIKKHPSKTELTVDDTTKSCSFYEYYCRQVQQNSRANLSEIQRSTLNHDHSPHQKKSNRGRYNINRFSLLGTELTKQQFEANKKLLESDLANRASNQMTVKRGGKYFGL